VTGPTLAQSIDFLRVPTLETLAIACGALPLALVVGAPAALLIVRGGPLGGIVRVLAALVRAIPELVLAIVFVVAIGFGPAAGSLALGISGAATIARLYAELLQAVPRGPEESLRATGAAPSVAFLVGLLPAAWPGLVGFAAYAFESIVRAAVIVGVVGAGGLGAALITSLNLLDYRGFAGYVGVLVGLVLAVDVASGYLRTRAPAWLPIAVFVGIAVIGAAAFAASGTPLAAFAEAPGHVARYLLRAWPPDFTPAVRRLAGPALAETLWVAVVGTLAGALLAVPLAAAVSAFVARGWMRGTGYRPWSLVPQTLGRSVAAIGRAVPPVALALVAVTFVGLGPSAGAFALAVHTTGVLGKLFAESLELADLGPAEALVAGGASATSAIAVGLMPGAFQAAAAHVLYRFEWNVRASTTLGIVGAGGIGQQIFQAQQLFHDRELSAYVTLAVGLVLVTELATVFFWRRVAIRTLAR